MANNLIKRDKNELVENESNGILDLYDAQFDSLSLVTINKEKQNEADNIITKVTAALANKDLIKKFKKSDNPDYEYVVEMNNEMKNAIEKGLIKFDVAKDGRLFAQIRENGKYGKKLSINKVIKDEGIEPEELTSALQIKAMQRQLEEMAVTLQNIEQTVSEVKQGQQDDRIGLFYSGMNMYLEGRMVSDPELKKYITSQALQSISNANAQLIQQIQTDRNYLLAGNYKKKKGQSYDEMQSRMESINRAFEIIYQSTMLKAAIYFDQKELQSMMVVLNEYKRFIEKVIIPVAPRLIEYDENVTTLRDTVWEKRANTLTCAESISQQITHADNYMIEYKEKKACQTRE
ncbi:MAG: hypothetical protein IK151_06895 [Erysipelotrichaceae bacterium]|nr:hypothetical protein [Erysipelotrichaceae bacterium]